MSIQSAIEGWLFKVALKKAIISASKLVVSWCASKGMIFVGTFFGITVDTGSQASIEALLTLEERPGDAKQKFLPVIGSIRIAAPDEPVQTPSMAAAFALPNWIAKLVP